LVTLDAATDTDSDAGREAVTCASEYLQRAINFVLVQVATATAASNYSSRADFI
jgi:hypothetical protein